ncbi:MAG TPA: DinB family protein [Verrucomicrobiae bacterium]|nr:DinB family protein [Verrucomicrobiae bacterium]
MNLVKFLRRQFAYNEWANREVLTSIRHAPDARSLELISHILAAEILWMDRLKQRPQSVRVWPGLDLPNCESKAQEVAQSWNEYLSPIADADLSREVHYTNSKGEPWTSTVLDVLNHVILHSAYHRGQIASHRRSLGQTPAYTDFIHATRQGLMK